MPYENGSSGVVPFMPVAPTGYGYGGGGFFGGDASSLVLILLLFGMFGNGGWGGNGNNSLYPWMNQSNQINDGFLSQLVNANSNAMDQMQASYQGTIAGLERSFDEQTANSQNFFSLQGQLSQCCCDNRLATCQTQNLIASDGAATRLAIDNAAQKISDKLCQLELDAKNETISELRTRLNMQSLAASQTAQTAALVADNTAQSQYLVSRIAPYPIPSYTVPNPFGTATTAG